MKEIWIDIRDYEGIYQVSNLGRVRSLDRIVPRGDKGLTIKGRILSMNKLNKSGYRTCILSRRDKKDYRRFNRLVAEAFIDNPDKKPFVNHIDGDKLNNHVDNLEWSTCSENTQHAYDTGLIPKGELHSRSKISKKDVRSIFKLAKERLYKQKEIAYMYDISSSLVSRILHGKERKDDTKDLRNDETE